MQRKTIIILFSTILLDMIGVGMIIPILPILLTDANSPLFLLTGYSDNAQFLFVGLIMSVYGLMQFIAAPILGEISDLYGRKKLLIAGIAVLAFAQTIFGFGVEIGSVWLLFISRAIAGIAGGNLSIAQASIADVTKPEDRVKNFGLISAAFGVGFILGPLLGGWIVNITGNAAIPFWIAGILGLINVFLITFFLQETNLKRVVTEKFTIFRGLQNIKAAFNDKNERPIYGASFFFISGFTFFGSFSAILLVSKYNFTESNIGTFFGIIGLWFVLTQTVITRLLSKKFKERTIVKYSLFILAVAFAIYPFMPSVNYLYLLLPFISIPLALSMANMTSLISKGVSDEKQGIALGINSSLMALAQGIIPIVAGIGSGYIAVQAPFIAGAIFVLVAWSFIFFKVKDN